MRSRLFKICLNWRVFFVLLANFSLLVSSSFAVDPSAGRDEFCVKTMLEERMGRADTRSKPKLSIAESYGEEVRKLQGFCRYRIFLFCKSDDIPAFEQQYILKALAQTHDFSLQLAFLGMKVEPKNPNYLRFRDYAYRLVKRCDPPLGDFCEPERWKTVLEDYLQRSGQFPERKFRRFGRWEDDKVLDRVPLLRDWIKKYSSVEHPIQNNERYLADKLNGLSGDALCVISDQACKKGLNDLSKAFSDAVGNRRREIFYLELEHVFTEADVSLPKQAYMDFKSDRFFMSLAGMAEENPHRYEALVNEAARRTTEQLAYEIETRFPEVTYLAPRSDPREWVKTASFFQRGYPPELNETLATYRARLFRDGTNLSEDQVVSSFLNRGKVFVANSQTLLRVDWQQHLGFVSSGLLESNGNISYASAAILRKLTGQNVSEKADNFIALVGQKFHEKVNLSHDNAALLVQMWEAQEKMSIPLSNGDKMASVKGSVSVLGSDGIGGGAYDAWAKGQAILDHWPRIFRASNDTEAVKLLFAALKEGDGNATQIIRSAPELMKSAVMSLPETLRSRAGMTKVFTSGDDAQIPLDHLNTLPAEERDRFFSRVATQLSVQSKSLTLSRAGTPSGFNSGPQVVRAFAGSNKSNAEAAEQISKVIEDRLSDRDGLGESWRLQYPHFSMVSWKGTDGKLILYFGGSSVDHHMREKIMEVISDKLRFAGDTTEVRFVH